MRTRDSCPKCLGYGFEEDKFGVVFDCDSCNGIGKLSGQKFCNKVNNNVYDCFFCNYKEACIFDLSRYNINNKKVLREIAIRITEKAKVLGVERENFYKVKLTNTFKKIK